MTCPNCKRMEAVVGVLRELEAILCVDPKGFHRKGAATKAHGKLMWLLDAIDHGAALSESREERKSSRPDGKPGCCMVHPCVHTEPAESKTEEP